MILIRLSERRHGLISWAFGTPSDFYRSSSRRESMLVPRKGGGGHGGGGKGSSGSGKSSSSSGGSSGKSSSSGSSSTSSKSSSISVKGLSGGKTTATTYGNGGGKTSTIPEGQPFAGRTVGGGTRAGVVGTSKYGSGYPPDYQPGGLPYYFWPIAWGSRGQTTEFGKPDNTSRPGGILVQASFFSNASAPVEFRVAGDNFTVTVIIPLIKYNCSMINNSTSSSTPVPYNPDASSCSISNASSCYPVAEQAIQYYRASTVVLTLDGYNNTAVFASNETNSNATSSGNATPLPSLGDMDQNLLGCLNGTIGAAVPLVDGAVSSRLSTRSDASGLVGSMALAICLIKWVL